VGGTEANILHRNALIIDIFYSDVKNQSCEMKRWNRFPATVQEKVEKGMLVSIQGKDWQTNRLFLLDMN
jgi:hypothetical protein